jgi:hypothetical protein
VTIGWNREGRRGGVRNIDPKCPVSRAEWVGVQTETPRMAEAGCGGGQKRKRKEALTRAGACPRAGTVCRA